MARSLSCQTPLLKSVSTIWVSFIPTPSCLYHKQVLDHLLVVQARRMSQALDLGRLVLLLGERVSGEDGWSVNEDSWKEENIRS